MHRGRHPIGTVSTDCREKCLLLDYGPRFHLTNSHPQEVNMDCDKQPGGCTVRNMTRVSLYALSLHEYLCTVLYLNVLCLPPPRLFRLFEKLDRRPADASCRRARWKRTESAGKVRES